MREVDREVLAMRHFEQLTNAEVARILEISEPSAHARYVGAARRLQSMLSELRDRSHG